MNKELIQLLFGYSLMILISFSIGYWILQIFVGMQSIYPNGEFNGFNFFMYNYWVFVGIIIIIGNIIISCMILREEKNERNKKE